MIKARPAAGDLAAGARFVDSLRPFIWRKNLDFEAIKDIHSIKRQIHAHRGGAAIAVGGHNIKLGRGGIREIEFFVQTQQLIWGGRRPALRTRSTVEGLARLVETGLVTADATDTLAGCYRYLRTLEHRLQMQDDRQTQTLPADPDGLDRIAAFMGAPDRAAFESELVGNLRAVELHYARLFEEAPDLTGPGNLVFTGIEDDPDTVRTLREMGYAEPQKVGTVVRAWHHGRYRAMRSTRARQILTELMPALLQAFARTVDPDAALARFDEVLARLPAGVQLFSLFLSNPSLLELVAQIAGSAPRLADQLARSPQQLDAVLQRDFYAAPPAADVLARDLADQLGQARDFQDTLDITRRWNNDRVFQVGIHILRDLVDPEAAAVHLTAIADAALSAVLAAVEAEIVKAHGRVPGGGFAIIGMGKLGGAELTVGADLDLLFIYDAPQDESSDGERPLPASQYYTRLAQRFIAAVTAPTAEGKLYDIDMRLRPSGNAGPIATSLEAFAKYQRESAWTWEHMALTRARVIAGPAALAARFMDTVRTTLAAPRDADKLLADVADMRARMVRELRSDNLWNAKHVRGGFVDVEFIAQYLELKHANARPDVLSANTADALMRLASAGLLDAVAADQLTGALHIWRRVQGMLRLTIGTTFDETSAPQGLKVALARTVGAVDFAAARGIVAAAADAAHRRFIDIIEAPAADIAARATAGEDKE
jgi:glutamate-ammonia-ligase adenylyltransferase